MSVDVSEMLAMEENAVSLGKSLYDLMGDAGRAVCDLITKMSSQKRILIYCGLGDNGGDGIVAAKCLSQQGYDVSIILVGNRQTFRSDHSKRYFNELISQTTIRPIRYDSTQDKQQTIRDMIVDGSYVIDALLGTGSSGKPRGAVLDAITLLNGIRRKKNITICSLDVPSGWMSPSKKWTGIIPDYIFSLHAPKNGFLPLNKYKNKTLSINLPIDAETIVGPGDLKYLFPRRKTNTHKGENGKLVILAGSKNFRYTGLISAMGAIRTGVDLIHLITPEDARLQSYNFPELIHTTVSGSFFTPDHLEYLSDQLKWCNTFLLGPGIGQNDETKEFVQMILESWGHVPHILDADALRLVSPTQLTQESTITPHMNEFQQLFGVKMNKDNEDRAKAVLELFQKKQFNGTLLLKGSTDIIANSHTLRYNRTGTPSLSKGGTGDLLAGLCAGLVARSCKAIHAACLSSYLLGKAGESVVEEVGEVFTLNELFVALAKAVKNHEK